MPTIVSYRKHIDALTTRELRLPESANYQRLGQELSTLDGITYVSVPDGATLPADQPAEIAASIAEVTLTPALRDAIANTSPQVRLIRARVQEMIADRYTATDERKLLRLSVGTATPSDEFVAYNEFVENCRQWGRTAKAELGL